jgi:hypothetical protein
MIKTYEIDERYYTIFDVADHNYVGFEVNWKSARGDNQYVKFRLTLDSDAKPCFVAFDGTSTVSLADLKYVKAIVAKHFSAEPKARMIVELCKNERDVLTNALSSRMTPEGEEDNISQRYKSVVQRIAHLEAMIGDAAKWTKEPSKKTFQKFLRDHRRETVPFSHEDDSMIGETDFHCIGTSSPFELARLVEQVDCESVVLAPQLNEFGEFGRIQVRTDSIRWPDPVNDDGKITFLTADALSRGIPDDMRPLLEDDGTIFVTWCWNGFVETLDNAVSLFESYDINSRLVIGTPDGTISGTVREIRNALASEYPSLALTQEKAHVANAMKL